MDELNKMKLTQLPYIVKDVDGNSIGQINVSINNNLTNASISLSFYSESKVINNKDIIKEAYKNVQGFFEEEMIRCGWDFLFQEISQLPPNQNE